MSGHPVGELARSEVFDVHTLAYVITLRRTSAQVHERAAGLLLRLLHRTENHRELALRALGHLYEEAMPEPPGLHMVRS
ncbi:hypothetical protein E1265_26115 [Streptomyces sp. 8K308]|nr:hypothetical protein E1265_26115 [Streptomyces sp. 8K308]